MGWDACLKGSFPDGGAFLGGKKQQERETLPHSEAWKVKTGHEEEEMSLKG